MELLEREQCFADLAQWLCAVAEHGGCIALVGGEAGIGKTALLQEFSKQQRDARVLWGACDALFTPRPLAPLHDIARQTKGALLATVNSAANREEIFTAALDELERSEALVVFEDMHWADEATLDLLKYLGRRIHRTRAMLAVTYRDDEVGARHPLRFVIGDLPRATTHRMTLSPLTEPAVAQLARQAGRPSRGLHRITGGNPFFVTEALATAVGTVPVSVRDAVLSRTSQLSPASREIAELVCVVPGRTEVWLLEQAVRPDEAGIEGCLGIGMVRYEDASLAFRNELARRALEDSLSQPRLQSLHSKVVAVLTGRPGSPAARLAHHANGARLQEQLSFEYYLTGQHEPAIEAQRRALEMWRASGQRVKEGESLRWLSRLSWCVGSRAEANRYGIDAVAILESLPPGPELAMAYCIRADLDMEAHEAESAIVWAHAASYSACGAMGEHRDSESCVEYSRHSSTHRRRRLWLGRSRPVSATRAGRWISGAGGWCLYGPGRYGRVSPSLWPGVTIPGRGADVLRRARPGFMVAIHTCVSCTLEIRNRQLAGSERRC